MSSNDVLRVGLIGYGARGNLAFHANQPENRAKVVACADLGEESRKRFAEKAGADAFVTDDYRRLLDRKDIDVVFVLSPDWLHEEQAVAALQAGKAVYLEKPMAITIEGCDRILATAAGLKGKIYIGHNLRHHSVFLKMKELAASGVIGEIKAGWCRHFISYGGDAYYKDWHAEISKGTGLLLQKGAHDIDVLHWLCGGYSKRVNAMGALTLYDQVTHRQPVTDDPNYKKWSDDNWPPLKNRGFNPTIEVEDLSMMLMELDNGVHCSYQQCHYTPDAWRNYTIIGTEGRLENFNDVPGEAVVRVWNRRRAYNPYGDEQHYIPRAVGGHGGADPAIVTDFLRYVRGESRGLVPTLAGRHTVAAGCAATHSLRNGGIPVDVPPVDPKVAAYFK